MIAIGKQSEERGIKIDASPGTLTSLVSGPLKMWLAR
jgi:hypothetical protein